MAIWKLEPIDTRSDHWATSMHKGTVIVRAPTEDIARQLATRAFEIKPAQGASLNALITPWVQRDLVQCTSVRHSKFQEDGPATVLDPPHYGDAPAESIA